MSAGKARQLGIPQDQLVYLHGCGDAYESKQPLYRPSMHRSEATRLAGDRTPLPARARRCLPCLLKTLYRICWVLVESDGRLAWRFFA